MAFALFSTDALATPGSLEFGKCTKAAGGKFKNAGCTKLAKSAEEQKFEWAPLSSAVAFTGEKKPLSGKVVLTVAPGSEVSCTGETQTEGEYGPGSREQKNIVLAFSGCEALGSECSSASQPAGHVNTLKLHGAPGIVKKEAKEEKNVDGVDFAGQTSEVFAEFSCGPIPVVLRGSVIVKVGEIKEGKFKLLTNKMLNKEPLEFTVTGGKQDPQKFEGEPKDVLEGSVGGGAFEEATLTLLEIQKTSPKTVKVELRQCEMNVC
ncbi:MAG: hypothetical protein E6G34_09500 [Actinobacteria bacterium]|nr:MAG: hypothetical protein E6G34_09500 [Actinomycetota bacterium]